MKMPPHTKAYNVGTCPGCREFLWAEVTMVATVGEPYLSDDMRSARAYVSAEIVGVDLARHTCTWVNAH